MLALANGRVNMQPRCLLYTVLVLLSLQYVLVEKAQTMHEDEAHRNTGFTGLEGNAFFALRSCHQVLQGESGEFFSPDYLCSNPGLWCNWTIQVPRGKRVHLYLEDLTADDDCHLKMDQIHLDESPVSAGESSILEKCWQTARYISVSDTVHVVQLIGPNPNPPHRGFYGQYQSYQPQEPPLFSETDDTVPDSLEDVDDELEDVDDELEDVDDELEAEYSVTQVADQNNIQSKTENPFTHTNVLEEVDEDVETEDHTMKLPDQKNFTADLTLPVESVDSLLAEPVEVSHAVEIPFTELWETFSGEIRRTRDGAEAQTTPAEGASRSVAADDSYGTDTITTSTITTTSTTTTHATSTEEVLTTNLNQHTATYFDLKSTHPPEETPAVAKKVFSPTKETDVVFVEMPPTDGDGTFQTAAVELEGFEESIVQLNSTEKHELASKVKGQSLHVQGSRNPAEPPHLPGGLLVEVTFEIDLGHAHRESFDHVKNSFRNTVENLIQKDLENLHPKSISSKRSKKLNAGVLLILWVQFGEDGREGLSYKMLQSTLQGLKGKSLNPHNNKSHGTITSVSVEDVDECETHLVMCDVHAECVNEFGSYSCHCHHGYSPGLGGAVCVEPEGEGCFSFKTSFPTLLYVVCLFLCLLIAVLLVVLVVLYRRYHRGAYLPHCHNSGTRTFAAATNDGKNNNSGSGVIGGGDTSPSRPPAPQPPIQLSRETSTTRDLPLLKFASLAPPEVVEGKLQKQKDQL